MSTPNLSALITEFLPSYDSTAKDKLWVTLSRNFHKFWYGRVMQDDKKGISEKDCDEIIRILDRNGRGNTKDTEAVAKAMVAQGAWQRMINEFHSNQTLGGLVTSIFEEKDRIHKASLIDRLYKQNEGKRNFITGPSGNVICAFLAAYDPVNNLSIISQKDRRAIVEFLGLEVPFDWDLSAIGTRIIESNKLLIDAFHELGLNESALTITRFCYSFPVKTLWKGEHTVKRLDKSISVTVPTVTDDSSDDERDTESIRESLQMQAMLAEIGTTMGFSIWLPKSDRGRILTIWKPEPGELIDELPFGYDFATIKTIEQIDVIWLRKRSIVRAFEVEHTTSVYSGLLRMADLVALQPNINIYLHIVAPAYKREKVIQEIRRPVFSLLEGRALAEMCTYISYDSIKEIRNSKHLVHLSDKVIEDYEERAE